MTYGQLESLVDIWSLQLQDQEKHFFQQAIQVNTWASSLIENGEKITILHGKVEKAKLYQKRLEQELDFVLSQQKKVEDLLIPLEVDVKGHSRSVYPQHADDKFERTYSSAENIDAQMKRIAQDLRDVTEHLNMFGRSADATELLQQICRILSAHLYSLQWINKNSGMLQRKVEEVTQVFKDCLLKEQERIIRIAFD